MKSELGQHPHYFFQGLERELFKVMGLPYGKK